MRAQTRGVANKRPGQSAVVMFTEKRKVGGSTPPLTTRSDQQKRLLTCRNAGSRRFSFSDWLRRIAANGGDAYSAEVSADSRARSHTRR
jgi:hypothetical protein